MASAVFSAGGSRAQGQLPNAKGTLDTIAAATFCRAYRAELANLNTTDEAVILYKKISGGSSKIVWQGTLQASGGRAVVDLGDLTAGDVVEGVTTTAAKVDYTLSAMTYGVI